MTGPEPGDLIREFRLRCWARENYAPPAARKPSWDPIVLDEMAERDAELAACLPFTAAGPVTNSDDAPHHRRAA